MYDLPDDATADSSKCLHIACGHEGGTVSVLHFTEVVDDETIDESFEELQSTSASVPLLKQMNDKTPYLVTSRSNMLRGHQDAISCLQHMPIYNKDGIMKSNCLVSGSKDSTFRVWDIGLDFREVCFGRDVESAVTSLTVFYHTVNDVGVTSIIVACEDNLIYIWDYDAADSSVSLNRRLIHHRAPITAVNVISCKSLDDYNYLYRTNFKSRNGKRFNTKYSKASDRPLYILSLDKQVANVGIICRNMCMYRVQNLSLFPPLYLDLEY